MIIHRLYLGAHARWLLRNPPECGAPGDRAHACLRRGSGPVARPLTTVLRVTGGAISTTDRRLTTRPCNLSRAEPSPRRCAARCRPRRTDGKTARVLPHFRPMGGGRPPATAVLAGFSWLAANAARPVGDSHTGPTFRTGLVGLAANLAALELGALRAGDPVVADARKAGGTDVSRGAGLAYTRFCHRGRGRRW